jgi:hypothetical protein
MVQARRMFLEKKYRRLAGITAHICGSKAEGLDMKGSDTDIMLLIGNAYENNGENVSEDLSCKFDSLMQDTYPGYVLMECLKHGRFAGAIPSNKLKDVIYTNMPNDKSLFEMYFHGPSIAYSAFGLDTDFVHVLKCESWPEIARAYILRKRCLGWLSQEMINEIVKQGCYIVPVGSKVHNGSENEWRLSYSANDLWNVKGNS